MSLSACVLSQDRGQHFRAFISKKCSLSRFIESAPSNRVRIASKKRVVVANLIVLEDECLKCHEVGLSNNAYEDLDLTTEDNQVTVGFLEQPPSFKFLRDKLYGDRLGEKAVQSVIKDVAKGEYSDEELAAFMISCTRFSLEETIDLTRSMVDVGRKFTWPAQLVLDKHCIGGIPGNRTTMIFVPILAAHGLTIPKLSSRAITSPSGTADTMEVIAPVNLTYDQMYTVVEKEGGCMAWGGGKTGLSPVDSEGAYVERSLNLDLYHWFVPAILSTKVAAGSNHILVDIPVGPTAKIESLNTFETLSTFFQKLAQHLGLTLQIIKTDGSQPIGRGIGPVLEARDVLSILRCEKAAPQDLREKSLTMAGMALEAWGGVLAGQGYERAEALLTSGQALQKFEAICKAQGGMKEPVLSKQARPILARNRGVVVAIDNHLISRIARLAGAPTSPTAGLDLHVSLNTQIEKGQPLFTLYAETAEELDYALHFATEYLETMVQITEV